MSNPYTNLWFDTHKPKSTSKQPKEEKGFQWDYFSKLVLLALFVSGTIIVFVGVIFEIRARAKEANKLKEVRRRRARRRQRKLKRFRPHGLDARNAPNLKSAKQTQEERLALLEEQILELEADDQIILDSATRTVNFVIVAVGALLQVVAYVSRFNWALNGQDSIIGMADSKAVW